MVGVWVCGCVGVGAHPVHGRNTMYQPNQAVTKT
jgi:hypothetical protein